MLRWLDPQGTRRKTQFHVKKAFDIAGGFLRERMDDMENGGEGNKDYLDVLLQYRGDGVEGPSKFSSRTINVILFVSTLYMLMLTCKCYMQFESNLSLLGVVKNIIVIIYYPNFFKFQLFP